MERTLLVLVSVLFVACAVSAGCTSPPSLNPPRTLLDAYVEAYNQGDADSIYEMLLVFDTPDTHPRYTSKEEIVKRIQESRYDEGVEIATYAIESEYAVENYAVMTVVITWQDPAGMQTEETYDVGFLYLNGRWRMVNPILPGEGTDHNNLPYP